jgi:polysaccharide export outer membrane protein
MFVLYLEERKMRIKALLILIICLLGSCSSKKQLIYLNDISYSITEVSYPTYTIQPQDILKIDVLSMSTEAAIPYNKISSSNINPNLSILQLEGYLVSDKYSLQFPTLGIIDVKGKTILDLESEIYQHLSDGGHLINPIVSIRLLNARFSILGEVKNPGTYSFVGERLSVLQALGYAGDLTIDGKRAEIQLIRETNGQRTIHEINLSEVNTLDSPYFFVHSNDVIIVKPNFNKVKSAGFIGSPQSISSIASLLLSITLLLTNN